MNRTIYWSLLGILTALLSCLPIRYAQAKPNILFIMADDLGWSDTSNPLTNENHPSDFYETPALERLASEGMAFTNAYASGANCAPTRAALLSGQWAQRPTNNIYQVGNLNRGRKGTLLVGPSQGLPSGADAIPTKTFTYAENLQQNAGYKTAHFGKFHVTTGARLIEAEHGFKKNYGGGAAGGPGNYHARGGRFSSNIGPELDPFAGNYTQQYVNSNIKPYANGTNVAAIDALVGTNKHISDALVDAAILFMNQEKAGSFFLQFNLYAVHSPVGNAQARSDLLNKYNNKPPGTQDINESFGALIEGMDQNVARLIHYLENTPDPNSPGKNLDENTLVLFYSDNGGLQSQSNNGPLKGQKGELDEGGIRVPLIAWSGNPALVDAGTINATPVASIDFYKTFAALSGAGDPDRVTLDGKDLSGIFADINADLGRDVLYWHLPGYLSGHGRNQRPQSVIRSKKWKLLYNYEDQSFELYNLEIDIAEANNLAPTKPKRVARLGLRLMNWLKDTDAPLARLRAGTLRLNVNGPYYANGEVTAFTGPLVIGAGEEVPLTLGAFADF